MFSHDVASDIFSYYKIGPNLEDNVLLSLSDIVKIQQLILKTQCHLQYYYFFFFANRNLHDAIKYFKCDTYATNTTQNLFLKLSHLIHRFA